MKKIILLLVLLVFCFSLPAKKLEPVRTSVGKLNVSVDPRTELLGVIQIMADYPLVTKNSPYSNEVKAYFEPMKDSKAVEVTKMLLQEYGFSYDAPVDFILRLSQPLQLKRTVPYSEDVKNRAGGEANLSVYRDAIRDFAKKSGFEHFYVSKKVFYERILASVREMFQGRDLVKTVEEYYKDSCNSYNMIICPLNGNNNYGLRFKSSNDKYDLYPVICGEGKYRERFFDNVILHEFNHSFVNPLTEKYRDKVELSKKLFEPIREFMTSKAYGEWKITLDEHIVRAVTARMMEMLFGKQVGAEWVIYEKKQGFVYIEPIIESLKRFESLRDSDGVTFAEYFPNLLSMLADLNPVNNFDTAAFNGIIDRVFNTGKIAVVYPTADCNQELIYKIKQYTAYVADFIKQKSTIKECVVISDSVALSKPLDEYGILCYGTIESNLFLSHYKETFPFQIKNGELFADKKYNDPSLRFITCLPNPQNNKNGMIVYTAFKNDNILDINSYSHGSYSYHIFSGNRTVLSESFYDTKSVPWKFIK